MRIQRIKSISGFTLIEVLVVIGIIGVLAAVALLAINPSAQRKKLYDAQRKRNLGQLQALLSNYYLDNIAYPRGEDICYDDPVPGSVPDSCSCHICGLAGKKDAFAPVLNQLFCDPEHPKVSYVYEYDCSSDFPLWYKTFAQLSLDPSEGAAGTNSCNYGIANKPGIEPYSNACSDAPSEAPGGGGGGGGGGSPTATPTPTVGAPTPTSTPSTPTATPTIAPPTPTPPSCPADPVPKYCIQGVICNNCGTFANCQSAGTCNSPLQLFSDGGCSNSCL